MIYTANYDKDDLEKQKITKVSFDELFRAFSAADKDENYRCEIGDHFKLYKVEPLDDVDVYEKIYIKIPHLKKTKLSAEATEVVARQMEDLVMLCDKLDAEKNLLKMCESDIERLNDQFYSLAKEKENYEKKVLVKCLALLNEKKKFIKEGMAEKNVAEDSSFDIHDFILNGGLKEEAIEPVENEFTSPVASTSRRATQTTTPKSSTPSQKPKRTPSKKLFEQINQPSDSDEDDSFGILSVKSTNSNKRKSTDDHPDTSSIFKGFKGSTPKKPKREERESSIEAKMMDISDSFKPREISSPSQSSTENPHKKYSDPLDAFQSQEICSQAICTDIKDDPKEDINSSDSFKGGRSMRSRKKNAYSLDTMNILDM